MVIVVWFGISLNSLFRFYEPSRNLRTSIFNNLSLVVKCTRSGLPLQLGSDYKVKKYQYLDFHDWKEPLSILLIVVLQLFYIVSENINKKRNIECKLLRAKI